MRQHKLKLPKTPGMSGLGLDMMAAGALAFAEDLADSPGMALVDPLVGQVRATLASPPHPLVFSPPTSSSPHSSPPTINQGLMNPQVTTPSPIGVSMASPMASLGHGAGTPTGQVPTTATFTNTNTATTTM